MKKVKVLFFLALIFLGFIANDSLTSIEKLSEKPVITSFQPIVSEGIANITTFVSPDCAYDALKEALESAKKSLFVEMYSFSNPYLLDIVGNLSAAGINVVFILEDDHVSYYESQYTYWAVRQLYLRGVKVYWASDTYRFAHAKFVIIDNSTVIIESENWAKSGIPIDPTYGNRGWGVIIEDQEIASYFLDVFLYDLSIAEPYDPNTAPEGEAVSYYVPKGDYVPLFTATKYTEYVKMIPILSPDFSENLIIDLINSANESIYIEQMYIYPTLNELINALINAKERGVEVKIILDPKSDENNETAEILTSHGIEVAYAYTKDYGEPHWFETMHNKGMIIDGKIVLISSINWSPTSLRENREAGIVIINEKIAQYYLQVFNYDWENAPEKIISEETKPSQSLLSYLKDLSILIIILIVIALLKWLRKK